MRLTYSLHKNNNKKNAVSVFKSLRFQPYTLKTMCVQKLPLSTFSSAFSIDVLRTSVDRAVLVPIHFI